MHRSILRGTVRSLCLLAALAVLAAPEARAQRETGTTTSTSPLDALRQRASLPVATGGVALEGAVDPAAYVVGPGDVFHVMIGSLAAVPASVTADGRLVLPEAGGVEVAGLTLAEARTRTLQALRPRYRNVDLEVALAQPRQFFVHVTGAVPRPGRYLAEPVSRVAAVVGLALVDSVRAVANPAYRPSLRAVQLVHRDGTTTAVDLRRYYATGDVAYNPYLRDGDVLHVPAYNPAFETVYVDGAVPYPGGYAHRPDDTVRDLLVLGTGTEAVPSAPLRLSRLQADGRVETRTLTAADLDLPLQPRDHLQVVQPELPGGTATVEGLVRYPGTYPITAGATTLQELVERAGGLRPEAHRVAYLERDVLEQPAEPLPLAPTIGTVPAPSRPQSPWQQVNRRTRLSDLDYFSLAYVDRELRTTNRLVLPLAEVLSPDAAPVVLRDGDRVMVPRDDQTVYVFGQVQQPGYVPVVEGRDASYYVEQAGGRAPLAGDAFVIDDATGVYVPADEARIASGDLLFVDRRTDVAGSAEEQRLLLDEAQQRTDRRFRTAQTILQTASFLASTITTIILIRDRN